MESQQVHELTDAQRVAIGLSQPASVFVTGSDGLQVSSWNSLAGVTVTIAGRFRTLDGEDHPFQFTHTPNTNRTIKSDVFGIGDGWLLNVTVFVSGAAPIVGQTFVRLQIVRGLVSSGIVLATLAARYVTAVQPIAWPGSDVRSSLDGQGAVRSVSGTTPAAGAELTEVVPVGARWRLISLRATLTTSAAVANRGVRLAVDDGVDELVVVPVTPVQAASLALAYRYQQGFGAIYTDAGVGSYGSLPQGLCLLAGHRFRTSTASIQAADQWSAIKYFVEEFLECAA